MPQPIDPHTELAKLTTAERIQQLADRAALAQHARHQHDVDQHNLAAESQVTEAHDRDEVVDSESRRRNPYAGKRHRRNKDEKQPHRPHPPDLEEHQLDVQV
jgi:hypothetical protein